MPRRRCEYQLRAGEKALELCELRRREDCGGARWKRVISCAREPIHAVGGRHAIAVRRIGECNARSCEQLVLCREAFGRSGTARGCWRCCARVARAGRAEITCMVDLSSRNASAMSVGCPPLEPISEPPSRRRSQVLRGRSVDLVAEFATGRYILGRHQTANNRLELLPVSSFFTTVCEDLPVNYTASHLHHVKDTRYGTSKTPKIIP